MTPLKTFSVFGEKVELLVNGAMTQGASAVIVQTNEPGGGPPPHSHTREDETFVVLEGKFELVVNGKPRPAPVGEPVFAPRGSIHTFRNVGSGTGRMLIFISPSGLEDYLEELGGLSPVTDMAKITEISDRYGIQFYL